MKYFLSVPPLEKKGAVAGKKRWEKRCAGGSQTGFSLITAIFLLVVLVSLGTLMMTFWAAQQQSSALDVLGMRAYQASKAGIEWGTYQITTSQVFASDCKTNGAASSPVSLLNTPLSAYSLLVSCYATSHSESGVPVTAYSLTSAASGIAGASPGGADYVERVTKASIWQ